ncbi:hypothetical protein [Brevibacillus borstelensis]|uniref:hypothetical protein n=1 Tax=Brevibacillus borstelensis TaxID=45462 RepID=UPI0030C02B95
MEERRHEKGTHTVNQQPANTVHSSLDEKEIEKRHQYQMFPTPDAEDPPAASEEITELDI